VKPVDEFDNLAARVRGRPVPALPSGLRDRVLADFAKAPEPAPIMSWQHAASLAAGVLVALNVAAVRSSLFGGPVAPRIFPPSGVSVASTDAGAVAPQFGSPWLPCDLPGGR
jgi:hypothetical protein